MTSDPNVSLSRGLPETVLPPVPPDVLDAVTSAEALSEPGARRDALGRIVAAHPTLLIGWATLAEGAADPVESYAYARVGYHRGLDALRAAGWRGSGFVRWQHESNQGFLRSLDALRAAAVEIGEMAEAERCDVFLHQLDPAWGRAEADS
jgi:hypothetical protein